MPPNISVDPAFKNVAGNMTGFHIWRIENMQVVPLPSEAWGKFFNGDAYIVLSSAPHGTSGGMSVKPGLHNGRVEQHIHFWLGEEATTDEAAIAAYKSVELDEHLGGSPIQHREVQGQESSRFQGYFKKGIRYLSGGAKTGLSHYVEDKSPKVFHVKGKRKPLVRQLNNISWSEMNKGDSYVIDVPEYRKVLIWRGANTNRFEKLQAANFADILKLEHGLSDIETVTIDDGQENDNSEDCQLLDYLLPLSEKNQIKDAGVAPDQDSKTVRSKVKLYRCSDDSGKLILTEVKDGPLLQEDLQSDDSYLIDNGSYGIWVWIGKRASQGERREAMRNAQGFIKAKQYKPDTPVTRVIDGGEPAEFKTLFKKWKDAGEITTFGRKKSSGVGRGIAKTVQTKFDAKTLHENPTVAATSNMVDDGTGVKEVFRVEMFDLVTISEDNHGIFFSGDCYVILYAYNDGKTDRYIIYYWLGNDCSQDEAGAAALRTVELDERLGGQPVQVRVVEGKEPAHFLAMFGGKMTVFQGGMGSSFDANQTSDGIPKKYLLQVHGTSHLNRKAVQETLSASSLNTNDCFVLANGGMSYVWFGKGSTGDEREMAKEIASQINADPEIMFEGQEKKHFWEELGGKQPYFDEKISKSNEEVLPPRLFQITWTGNIKVEEIGEFGQEDLIPEDVMLLDVTHTIFLWFGALSNKYEQQEGVRIAKDYLDSCPNERDGDTPIIIIKQALEPPNFTGHFGVWEEDKWNIEELYAEAANDPTLEQPQVVGNGFTVGYSNNGSIAYSVLISADIPSSVDPAKKEEYLSDAEFVQVFEMDRDQFSSMPGWKQVNLKRSKHLF